MVNKFKEVKIMSRIKIIQLQGSVLESIVKITSKARFAVSKVCLGIDDMNVLGNKALVLRTEIYPLDLTALYESLASVGVKLIQSELPDMKLLQEDIEYPLSIQIVSLSEETDRRINLPQIPG